MNRETAERFFSGNSNSYDRIVRWFTYGADGYWKRRILARVPAVRRILDLACGTGILTLRLAERNPCASVVGVDMTADYLVQAGNKPRTSDCGDVHFVCARAEEVALRQKFDCVTSSYIPKYVNADTLLGNIAPLLNENGILVLHDFSLPRFFLFRWLWLLHMSFIRRIGGRWFPEWQTVLQELKDVVMKSDWEDQYRAALPRHGFEQIKLRRYTFGSSAIISAVRAG